MPFHVSNIFKEVSKPVMSADGVEMVKEMMGEEAKLASFFRQSGDEALNCVLALARVSAEGFSLALDVMGKSTAPKFSGEAARKLNREESRVKLMAVLEEASPEMQECVFGMPGIIKRIQRSVSRAATAMQIIETMSVRDQVRVLGGSYMDNDGTLRQLHELGFGERLDTLIQGDAFKSALKEACGDSQNVGKPNLAADLRDLLTPELRGNFDLALTKRGLGGGGSTTILDKPEPT